MGIADDFEVGISGNIRHIAGTGHYTVLELHRFLQDLADNAQASGDDLVDITSRTPSERQTDNIIKLLGDYNIDDDAAEYFYDGSILQGTGGTEALYSGLMVLGAVNNKDTQLQVVQNNTLFQAGSPFWGDQSTGGYNGDAASGVLMRCLIKSRTAGADIDGRRIRVVSRHWGDTYDFFNVTLGVGESVAAIGTTPDAQNTTARGTVAAYTHVSNLTQGYNTIDLNNGNGAQPYYSKWTYGADSSGDGLKGVWEFIKYLSGDETAETLYGLNGFLFLGITHEFDYDNEASGPFQELETLSWGTGATAGTGLLLALKDDGLTGTMWIQLLTGVAPSDNLAFSGITSLATADVNGAPVLRTIPKIFLGSYTGTLIGAFGVGVTALDLTASDTVQDLLGATQTPPNNVTFTVSGIVSGDYVLVGPRDGSGFDFDQRILHTTLSGGTETAVIVTAAIPADTPAQGNIRIELDSGIYRRVEYTSWTGSTFTIGSTDFTGDNATAPANVWISYIDEATASTSIAFTTIYSASRDLWIRVRNGGGTPIKTFESPGTLGVAGGSLAALRILDS